MKYKWGNKNVLDYAVQEAVQGAVKQTKQVTKRETLMEAARELKKEGLSIDLIVKTTFFLSMK